MAVGDDFFQCFQIISYRGAQAPVVEFLDRPASQLFNWEIYLWCIRVEGERKEGVREREKKRRDRGGGLNKEKI